MKRFVAIGLLVLAAVLVTGAWTWGGYIFEDPIFGIGNQEVNVLIGMSIPDGETVSGITSVVMLVPKNLPARVIDPMGLDARIVQIGAQRGPVRVCLAMVKVPTTDQGSRFPIQVTVFDQAGYSLTMTGRAGAWVVVPYMQRP